MGNTAKFFKNKSTPPLPKKRFFSIFGHWIQATVLQNLACAKNEALDKYFKRV